MTRKRGKVDSKLTLKCPGPEGRARPEGSKRIRKEEPWLVYPCSCPTSLISCLAELKIENREGFEKFKQMIAAQGGSLTYIDAPDSYPEPKHALPVLSDRDGWIQSIDAFEVGLINNKLGGGRETLDSKIDFKAGLIFHLKVGDQVKVAGSERPPPRTDR
eukprot:524378-Hanusia_phi.AAC.14